MKLYNTKDGYANIDMLVSIRPIDNEVVIVIAPNLHHRCHSNDLDAVVVEVMDFCESDDNLLANVVGLAPEGPLETELKKE